MSRSLEKYNQKAKECWELIRKQNPGAMWEVLVYNSCWRGKDWGQGAQETEGGEAFGRMGQWTWTCCEWRAGRRIPLRVGDANRVVFWFHCLEIREGTDHRDTRQSSWWTLITEHPERELMELRPCENKGEGMQCTQGRLIFGCSLPLVIDKKAFMCREIVCSS